MTIVVARPGLPVVDRVKTVDVDPRDLDHFHPHMLEYVGIFSHPPVVVDSDWVRSEIKPDDPMVRFHGSRSIANGFIVSFIDVRWFGDRLRLILDRPLSLVRMEE